MSVTIWWIRRDLRLTDNQALSAAVTEFDEVIPLFIVDPKLIHSEYTGEKRLSFLWEGLRRLDTDLRGKGSRLIIRKGKPVDVVEKLISQTQAKNIFTEADYSPYACTRDKDIAAKFPLCLVGGPTYRHPNEILKNDGSPYTVFTPYMRSWRAAGMPSSGSILPAPEQIKTPKNIEFGEIPDSPSFSSNILIQPGEEHAKKALKVFLTGQKPQIFDYSQKRNRVDLAGTSFLSPYLRFGMVSVRECIVSALTAISKADNPEAKKGAETWLNELVWREFYVSILYHFPYVRKRSFRPEYQNVSWVNHTEDFQAWCEGRTGYPIVDAAMRQLKREGWMHNRARMIVASFLVKDLLIDWRWGEKWFMQHLIDGDPAANNGGWQWTAGTGTDSAPYFRVFNPILQSKKYDPHGKYIRKWVTELSHIPDQYIHEPWKMPVEIQKQTKVSMGNDYPEPIVDHSWARERVLKVYRKARD